MPEMTLNTEIQFVGGVGPKLSTLFHKLGIKTAGDLITTAPRRYEDRSNLPKIAAVRDGAEVTIKGQVTHCDVKTLRGGKILLKAYIDDGTGIIGLTWFNQPWIAKKLQSTTSEVLAYGTVKQTSQGKEMNQPDLEFLGEEDEVADFARIAPVYGLTEGLSQAKFRKVVSTVLQSVGEELSDALPAAFRKSKDLPNYGWSINQLHWPDSMETLKRARERLIFEEFLYAQLALAQRHFETTLETGIAFPIDRLKKGLIVSADEIPLEQSGRQKDAPETISADLFVEERQEAYGHQPLDEQIKGLFPYQLTGAQARVVEEIFGDMALPHPMNRLIQGDVGSGKTAVAACAMLAAVRSHFQAALMAPTELLAEQHYFNLKQVFEPAQITVVLLAGKLTAKNKKQARELAASGQAQIFVGTQALIAELVEFHRLGLIIVDEQHRFGVMQRAALRAKSHLNPDVLFMTATPIPRTLAQAQFGDLDVSIIDELPPGRIPITTHWRTRAHRVKVYQAVKELLQKGCQAYVVCPLVSESELMMAQAAEELYRQLTTKVLPEFKIGLLHGKLPVAEKESLMDEFRKGQIQLLVSTTVIEVGVDVPNASVMVIEDANRFGLAQLHQLRGRVGRGSAKSFCVLVGDATTEDAAERLQTMVETTDGFLIAEKDMQLRGPGDVAGTMQSGYIDFRFADLIRDAEQLSLARTSARAIVNKDAALDLPGWEQVKSRVKERRSKMGLMVTS